MAEKTGKTRKRSADKIISLPIGEIRPYEKNPRKNAKAVKYVKASIEKFGFKQPIIVDSNRVIIAGHTRLEAAKSLGMAEVPCIVADDLTDAQVKALRLADNKVAEFAEWDLDLLGGELGELADISDIDMGDFGFDLSEFDNIGLNDEETEVVEDEVPEEVEPVCKKGEIWLLGEHRLMCGDSTDADAVAKLMNGERADLVFTDPPYGMNLTPNYKSIHKNHQAKAVDYQPIIGDQDVFDARFIFDLFEDTKEMFLWGADYFRHTIPLGGGWFVWDKTCGKHEGRIGNEFELCWSKQQHKKEIIRIQWAGFVGMEEEDGARVHPTQKPVRLAGWFLSKYSKDGDIVADLFGGSGSTMIACEQLGRKCRMMELDPHYCDVIIARWEKLTGQTAVKVDE